MGKDSSPSTVTQSVTNEPWSGAVPLLSNVMNTANSYGNMLLDSYNAGNPLTYQGSRVAPMNQMQGTALGNLFSNFSSGSGPYSQYGGSLGGIAQGNQVGRSEINNALGSALTNVVNPAMTSTDIPELTNGIKTLAYPATADVNNAVTNFGNTVQNNLNPALVNSNAQMGQYGGAVNQAINAPSGLMGTATGQMLSPNTNPYLAGAYQAANRQLTDAFKNATGATGLAGTANQAGAYGGSAWALRQAEADKNLAAQQSDLANQMYSGAYNQERQNQLNAANQLAGLYGTEAGRQAGLLGQAGNLYANQVGARNDLLGQLTGAYGVASGRQLGLGQMLNQDYLTQNAQQLQALGMLPTFDQNTARNLGVAMSVGDALQQQGQNEINAAMQAFNEGIYGPLNLISSVGNIGMTGGQMGGTGTTTSPYYGPSIGSQILQGLGTGAGLYGLYNQARGLFG